MHTDLREFLSRLGGTVVMTLVPMVVLVFLCMPSSLHHHLGHAAPPSHAPAVHMT